MSFFKPLGAIAFILFYCVPMPPGVPSNVRASISGNSITVAWDKVSGADSYDVCRKMEGYFSSSGSCSELNAGTDVRGTSMTYTETPSNNTTFTYRVRASNNVGTSDWSDYSNAIVH
jgi:hypothetical protein